MGVVAAAVCWADCTRSPYYILTLPDNSYGWVRVRFGVRDAPPLARRGRRGLIVIPLSGEAATSDKFVGGEGFNEFRYQNGAEAEMRNQFTTANTVTGEQALYVYIGTSAERADPLHGMELPTPGLRVRR